MYQIVLEIFKWYSKNHRNLPWRNTKDPYKIWLSEIILQQTQVKQGLSYYHRFVVKYPVVNDLAGANEDDVLKLWQGLGYYSRARNLHKAAKTIASTYNGKFPKDHKELLKLPGIGEYTAAAIASFAFDLPYPVLDGNVFRFLSRLFNIDTPVDEPAGRLIFMKLLEEMITGHPPALFNNAMMEMGATVCKPANPLCMECPVSIYCEALKQDTIQNLPVKSKKTKTITRYFNFIHIDYKDGLYLEKRTKKDIWQNLFQLPLIETDNRPDRNTLRNRLVEIVKIKGDFELVHKMKAVHLLSHQVLQTDFWYIKPEKKPEFTNRDMRYTKLNKHKIYAVPKLIDNYLLLL